MALIPIKFPSTPRAVASYDWQDIASGTGYERYFGIQTSGSYYLTSESSIYSNKVITAEYSSSGAWQLMNDLDFDVQFKLAQNIKGTVIANIPIGFKGTTSARLYETYADVLVRKWDGTAETEIASAISDNINNTDDTTDLTVHAMVTLPIEISTRQHFKKDETLRITVRQYARQVTNSANADWIIGHDPPNRITSGHEDQEQAGGSAARLAWDANIPSIMSFQIPFVITD